MDDIHVDDHWGDVSRPKTFLTPCSAVEYPTLSYSTPPFSVYWRPHWRTTPRSKSPTAFVTTSPDTNRTKKLGTKPPVFTFVSAFWTLKPLVSFCLDPLTHSPTGCARASMTTAATTAAPPPGIAGSTPRTRTGCQVIPPAPTVRHSKSNH